METIETRKKSLEKALASLHTALNFMDRVEKLPDKNGYFDYDELYRAARDSMIQRFEFCLDSFWKTLKVYLTHVLKVALELGGPKAVIKEAAKAKVILEKDSKTVLEMIDDRNMSSHIYKEEIAEQISSRIPGYYKLISQITENLK